MHISMTIYLSLYFFIHSFNNSSNTHVDHRINIAARTLPYLSSPDSCLLFRSFVSYCVHQIVGTRPLCVDHFPGILYFLLKRNFAVESYPWSWANMRSSDRDHTLKRTPRPHTLRPHLHPTPRDLNLIPIIGGFVTPRTKGSGFDFRVPSWNISFLFSTPVLALM